MRLISFNIYNLKKNSLIEYLHVFIEKAEKCQTATAQLRPWLTTLKTTFAEAERIYHISLKSPLTELLATVDGQRDGLVTGIKAIVRSFEKSENPAERDAARVLWVGLSSLKHNTNDQYVEQTGQVDNLLYFLETQEAESVRTLRLTTQVEQLRTVNDRMHELIEGRVDEVLSRDLGAFAKARATAEEAYRQFVMSVNSWALLNADRLSEGGSDDAEAEGALSLAGFIKWANANIEFYNRKVLKMPASEAEEEVADGETSEGEGQEGTDSEGGENGGSTGSGAGSDGGNGSTGGGSGSNGGNSGSTGGNNPGSGSGTGIPIQPGPGGDDPDLK